MLVAGLDQLTEAREAHEAQAKGMFNYSVGIQAWATLEGRVPKLRFQPQAEFLHCN